MKVCGRGEPSVYRDYSTTKAHVLELEAYLEAQPKVWTLTHIDAVPDNFLFVEKNGGTEIRLIDWEYAGMQDAHVDLAMFCIYAMYDRPQVDALIDCYFTEAVRRRCARRFTHTLRCAGFCGATGVSTRAG
mgnify:FL=1